MLCNGKVSFSSRIFLTWVFLCCSRGNNSATSNSTVPPRSMKVWIRGKGTSFHSKPLNHSLHILIGCISLSPEFFPEFNSPELYLSASHLSWASYYSAVTVDLILHVEVAYWSVVSHYEVLCNVCISAFFFFFDVTVSICKAQCHSTPRGGSFIQLNNR